MSCCRVWRCALPVMVLSFLASCGDDPPGGPVAVLATVNVTLASSTIQVGLATTANAAGLDQYGHPVTLSNVIWSSANTDVATVSPTGQVTAVAPGQAQITAVSGSKSGQAALTVIPVPVASVTVTPSPDFVIRGDTRQLTAATLDANGGPLTGRAVTWSTSNPNLATVSASGLVSGVSEGPVTITATSEGKSGSASLTVVHLPVASVEVTPTTATMSTGTTQQLTARPLSNTGAPFLNKPVTWSSSDESKARVNASGLVTAVAAGSATITATSETKSGTSLITVTP